MFKKLHKINLYSKIKEQTGYFVYTLGRAKSKGSIDFVLSLKLEEESHFPKTPQSLIFAMQLVFFTV